MRVGTMREETYARNVKTQQSAVGKEELKIEQKKNH